MLDRKVTMSTRKKPTNFVQRLLKRVWRSFNVLFKALLNGVLRSFRVNKRRSRQSQAGFVLPTVVMVVLVVALLTTAIVIRSFDRAKNASNFRVDQAVLNAATPAIDRAKAKIERLLSPDENRLAGSPPLEGTSSTEQGTISFVLSQPQYTFGDETRLKLAHQDGANTQTLETVWKFPVDTDNNGKYDTFTLYGIYFRNPLVDSAGDPTRERTPVEARAVPQATGAAGNCGASSGGAASSTSGWYQTDGQLKKAFFVYVANVPISATDITQLPATAQSSKYELYKGNKGFSALEMQEDQARISLDNNAVWYDDDLVISNVPTFRLNGRIHTNSNLMVANPANNQIVFRQVSAIQSCYYTRENGLITVGGNVVAGDVSMSAPSTNTEVQVDLYNPTAVPTSVSINGTTQTTTLKPNEVASISGEYEKRLNSLVQEAFALHPPGLVTKSTIAGIARYPQEVKEDFNNKYVSEEQSPGENILRQVLSSYFAKRIRRVSYKENQSPVAPPYLSGNALDPIPALLSSVPTPGTPPALQQPDPNVPPNISGTTMQVQASKKPNELRSNESDAFIGDRVLVGNALPTQWLKTAASPNTYAKKGDEQNIPGVTWAGGQPRQRVSQAQQLDDLGDTSRGGFWEQAAAYSGNAASTYKELAGGLRVVTGAGIYIDEENMTNGVGTGKRGVNSFLPVPPTVAELQNIARTGNPNFDAHGVKLPPEIQGVTGADLLKYKVVWPDTMPMFRWDDTDANGQYTWGGGEVKRGDLQMRATVVYHYNETGVPPTEPIVAEDTKPIACIATYYDPTNKLTAQNVKGVPQIGDQETTDYGTSINGVTYPHAILPSLRTAATNLAVLRRQADMIFPNGRWVNEPLRVALKKITDGTALALNDIAAIDAANCALTIMYGASVQTNALVPTGAIQERTFLDARQIKAIHKRDTNKAGTLLTHSDLTIPIRQTLQEDITNPAKLKIAELGSLLNTEYSLPIEQRQPLEIRVTQIDLAQLRSTPVGTGTGSGITSTQEYMLPNTGIIYATRDDALADASDPAGGSATDFKLDPTRRPNGIRIVNGENLARENAYRLVEKGLILASDLPVYIKGPFNLHVSPGTTNFREEFNSRPNFYTGAGGLDPNFACRPGSCPSGSTTGDQWRPARILADAVTLLSRDFRDGYRNEGDFDLNNNSGNLAVEARLKNGFWWNSFATSAEWYAADGYPDLNKATAAKELSSYVTNGVTPIQRRVNFPEYKMEICEKFPVSACGPTDWKQSGGTTAAYEGADTTNARYVDLGKRVFPRRVTFQRNAFGQLIPGDPACIPATLTDRGNCRATPIAATGALVPYGTTAAPAGSAPPAAADNALWYVTTTDNANPSAGISYDKTKNLYYPPFDTETVSERQFLLPAMPESLTEILKLLNVWSAATPSLNGTTADDTPDYAVYSYDGTNCHMSKAYLATANVAAAACPVNAGTGIGNLWTGLRNPSLTSILPVVSVQPLVIPAPVTVGARIPISLQATAKLNIYDLPLDSSVTGNNNAVLSNLDITLDPNSQDNPIFVFRTEQNIDFQLPVTVKLVGVDPNNIFWVSKLGTRIVYNPAATPQHQLVGNFIGGNDGVFLVTDAIATYTQTTATIPTPLIQGGRILGFNKTYPTGNAIPAGVMTALTTTDQPLVMPVLQLHSPQGSPSANYATVFDGITVNANYWVQRVPSNTPKEERTYNGVFIMGDSPSRPPGESGGGLPNFPRFLEAWEDTHPTDDNSAAKATNEIKGSFIQFKKSAFATAPFEAIDDPTQDNSLFFDGVTGPLYMAQFNLTDYRYKGGGQGRKAPYYRPPIRDWGYDVGLLSQTPDLFSRRFANPTAGTPNQYFRQVNRNDPWIETLLCAAQPTTGGAGYERAIADPTQRPSNCPPIAAYN
jgi:type II secretory pathway pseudopilin PulG